MDRRKLSCLKLDDCSPSSVGADGGLSSPRRWYRDIRELLLTTVHQCKVGVSYVCPSVCRFSMTCEAYVEESGGEGLTSVVVGCFRADRIRAGVTGSGEGRVQWRLGRCKQPRLVAPGDLRIRVIPCNGLQINGDSSTQHHFRGNHLTAKFPCTIAETQRDNEILGTVIVEEVGEKSQTIFRFSLTNWKGSDVANDSDVTGSSETQSLNPDTTRVDASWSVKAIRQLAAALHLCEDDNWRSLAKQLGFTDAEIHTNIEKAVEPFEAMLDAYRVRGGTPEEFADAVYDLATKVTPTNRGLPSNSFHDNFRRGICRTSKAVRRLQFSSPAVTPLSVRVDDHEWAELNEDELQYQVQRTTGACLQMAPLPVFFPLTPPPTPRKRTHSSSSSSSSESGTPTKKSRASPVFIFPEPYSDVEDSEKHLTCQDDVTTSTMWLLSHQLNHHWKSLARTLNIPETDIICIEHEFKELRECAYQVLLKWQQMFPESCVLGKLFSALCDCGLRSLAVKYSTAAKDAPNST